MRKLAIGAALFVASPATGQDVGRWHPQIAEASLRLGVPSSWIEHVMRAESAGLSVIDGRPTRSRVGAMGLMQLIPATWSEMRERLQLGSDPDDPHDNILAGTLYLRLLYDRFGYPGLFAAYNAGPARYAAFLAGEQRLPSETVAYLQALTQQSRRAVSPPPQSLFMIRRNGLDEVESPAAPVAAKAVNPSIFAVRKPQP